MMDPVTRLYVFDVEVAPSLGGPPGLTATYRVVASTDEAAVLLAQDLAVRDTGLPFNLVSIRIADSVDLTIERKAS